LIVLGVVVFVAQTAFSKMKTKVFVKDNYSDVKYLIERIPLEFDSMGELIFSGRNQVRIIRSGGYELTVKSFKKPSFLNAFVYANIRKSKAERSFWNSRKLQKEGFSSPDPVAFVNCYNGLLLKNSYYVSLYTNYNALESVLHRGLEANTNIIKAFARFAYRLHKRGIFHKDFNVTNVLFYCKDGVYDFSLIDNNRMGFGRYSLLKGLRNLRRLTLNSEYLGVIASEYATACGQEEIKVLNILSYMRLRFIYKVLFKLKLKKALRLI
jgi:tRNA A-37 threonylcarbamoyl transferase component Bud32